MRSNIRVLGPATVVIAAVVALAWASPMAAVVHLLADTAVNKTILVMGGTQHPLVNPAASGKYIFDGQDSYPLAETGLADPEGNAGVPAGYVAGARDKYAIPAAPVETGGGYNTVAVYSPEEFWPTFGSRTFDESVDIGVANLNACLTGAGGCIAHIYPGGAGAADEFVVFGYSQSARVASIEKRNLIDQYGADLDAAPAVSFVLIGNPNRPNGGILERFNGLYIPILGVTFDGATPTNSCDDTACHFATADISRQYDGWSDFPVDPLNLLADANALAGIAYLHPDYFGGTEVNGVTSYLYQGQVGDTNYYMIASARLPILTPLAQIGVPDPVLAALDAPLRVMVEWGYDRQTSPGIPTTAQLIRLGNPLTDLVNLAVAIPTGWDDGISEAVGNPNFRPFNTTPTASAFGVGGPVLPTVTEPTAPAAPSSNLQGNKIQAADTGTVNAMVQTGTVDATVQNDDAPDTGDQAVSTDDSTRVPVKPGKRLLAAVRDALGADADRPKVFRPNFGDRPLKKALEARNSVRPNSTDGDADVSKKADIAKKADVSKKADVAKKADVSKKPDVSKKALSGAEKKVGPRRPDKLRHHDDAA